MRKTIELLVKPTYERRLHMRNSEPTMNRRDLLKVAGMGALGAMLPACGAPMSRSRLIRTERRFAIPKISWDRVIRTVVGLRPCREAFFRVETERLGEKIVIHNYGHCARGVGLSWGTSHLAVEEALRTGQTRYAVLGCGVCRGSSHRSPVAAPGLRCHDLRERPAAEYHVERCWGDV